MPQDAEPKSKAFPAAHAGKIAELVAYQDGAVVSREIVKRPAGNVTLFAFDEGQGLTEHTSPFDALVQVLEGEVEITISGKPYRLQGGGLILMPANQPHALKAIKRFKMILIMIRSWEFLIHLGFWFHALHKKKRPGFFNPGFSSRILLPLLAGGLRSIR